MNFTLSNILFILLFLAGVGFFAYNARKVMRNIRLGRDKKLDDRKGERFATMLRVAFGQSKMMIRPIPGILHLFVYVGFVIINIEVLEIAIDGIFGTHRVLSFMGGLYTFLIAGFEWLALFVLIGCLIFLARRNVVRVRRLVMNELDGWPKTDANLILITEVLLMSAFLTMNAADLSLQGLGEYAQVSPAAFPVSSMLAPMFEGMSASSLIMLERGCWWFHIIGIFAFLNYLPYSKHFHILLAFPNTYYSRLSPRADLGNVETVTNEVKLMLDPSAVPPAADPSAPPARFGAKDVQDLTWKQLLDAYSCTECGRCTSACPANQTGKLLSPRHIMMGTRDRLEEVGKNIDKHGKDYDDGKSLLDHISPEELWACTSCQACIYECPVNIDPLSIIIDMRRYLVMEQSAAPQELNMMFTNTENNGAPWQMSPADRFNWSQEV